jgi:3'-5' exoribonuclease
VTARELTEGLQVDLVLLVRERAQDRVTLADRTGSLSALVSAEEAALCEPGTCVRVSGRVERGRLAVDALRPARTDEYVLEDLLDGPRVSAERMEADLRELVSTVQCAHLRALLERVFGPGTETWAAFREAPAAKRYHQAYRHGLLEHSLTVAQGVSAISATFGGVDRDVAVTGALLHDIGKLDAYTSDPLAIDMTDLGKLQGEIPLGYYRVRRLIEDIAGFPREHDDPHHPMIHRHLGRVREE